MESIYESRNIKIQPSTGRNHDKNIVSATSKILLAITLLMNGSCNRNPLKNSQNNDGGRTFESMKMKISKNKDTTDHGLQGFIKAVQAKREAVLQNIPESSEDCILKKELLPIDFTIYKNSPLRYTNDFGSDYWNYRYGQKYGEAIEKGDLLQAIQALPSGPDAETAVFDMIVFIKRNRIAVSSNVLPVIDKWIEEQNMVCASWLCKGSLPYVTAADNELHEALLDRNTKIKVLMDEIHKKSIQFPTDKHY